MSSDYGGDVIPAPPTSVPPTSVPPSTAPRTLPLDRILIRSAVAIAVIVVVVIATLARARVAPDADARPVWIVVLGWVAALVVVGLMLREASSRLPAIDPLIASIALVVASSVVGVAFDDSVTTWVSYIGVAVAGASRAGTRVSVLLGVVPLVALGLVGWLARHDWLAVVVNVGIGVSLLALLQLRSRQRDNEELASAQRAVIAIERDRAAAAERQRQVAEQLHDVLAHTLSGLIITLQAATLTARRQDASPDLVDRLTTATALARDGLSEARSAVESLHRGAAESTESLEQWMELSVARLCAAVGLELTVDGSFGSMPAQWSELTRSVIMEGLTNSMRHAVGAPVQMTVDEAGVEITSLGDRRTFIDRAHPSGGHGLDGLRRRVDSAGGVLEYGATERGYRLALRFAR